MLRATTGYVGLNLRQQPKIIGMFNRLNSHLLIGSKYASYVADLGIFLWGSKPEI
jgi:hypothetical protein